ncbi:MAG: PH domain-containing protein [Roseburia sp.]
MSREKEELEEKNLNGDRDEDLDEVQFVERKRWPFLGLPWTFTKYTITPSTVTVDQGLLKTVEDDCYMYKIQDVRLTTSFIERIFKLGTILCYTGDVTNKELVLSHIKHAKEIKNYLLKASEAARIRRRTLNTLDIGAGADLDDVLDD